MADFKKVIDIIVDSKKAERSIKKLTTDFGNLSKSASRDIANAFNFNDAQRDLFKKLQEATKQASLKTAIGDTKAAAATKKEIEAISAAMKSSGDEGKRFIAILKQQAAEIENSRLAEQIQASQLSTNSSFEEGKQQAESAKAAHLTNLMHFIDLNQSGEDLSDLEARMNTLGLSADQMQRLTDAMKEQTKLADDINAKEAKLNALRAIGEGHTKEAIALEKELVKQGMQPKSDLAKARAAWSPSQRLNEAVKKSGYDSVLGMQSAKLADSFYKAIANAVKKIATFFVNTFKNAFEQLKEMATYDAGTSLFSNKSARERQLTFGLSGAQNYAMSTAMRMMNMQGIEDLMWANANQKRQYDRITEILEAQYNKLESSGIMETVQQFQLDMSMMKMQFQNTIYQFIAAHKSQLEKVLQISLVFMEGVLTFLGWIVDGIARIFGNDNYSSADMLASSSVSNVANTDNSRTISATINYTNNQADNGSQKVISESVLNQLITVLNT